MGYESVGPMLAILDGDNPEMKVDAVKVLAGLGGHEAARWRCSHPTVRPAATAGPRHRRHRADETPGTCTHPGRGGDAAVEGSKSYFHERQPIRGQLDGQVQVWFWDPAET